MTHFRVQLLCSCEEAIRRVTHVLEHRGFKVTRGFDLQSAMATLPEGCPCPYHGTTQCTCNYTVLLVYELNPNQPSALPPQCIAVHSHHDQTWLTLLSDWEEQGRDNDASAMAQTARLMRGLVDAMSGISA